MGVNTLRIPFPFLKDTGGYDNTNFPMSSIMAYLPCETCTIIMRFDGTVTTYRNGNIVFGFTRFNLQDILINVAILQAGSVVNKRAVIEELLPCRVYTILNSTEFYFECLGDPEPIAVQGKDNHKFLEDLLNRSRVFPKLKKIGDNIYGQLNNEYIINGVAIPITGYKMM